MSIDFVIPWVDGSDPEWRRLRAEQAGNTEIIECRFRDWGVLKYWFRSVEENAPWVRKVFFITCGQTPEFLNTENPKLVCVNHSDYIPTEYLPTFSSHPIELNLFRIEELAENFVYFNDDIFLNRPVEEKDFFRDGLPCYEALEGMIVSDNIYGTFPHILLNNMAVINKHFDKKSVYKKNWRKWLNLMYGKDVFHNILMKPFPKFQGFVYRHVANPLQKSVMRAVWEVEEAVLDRTSSHKFREITDVNQYLFQYWSMMNGAFAPYRISSEYFDINEANMAEVAAELKKGSKKLICVNDNENLLEFEPVRACVAQAFEARYPEKCSFER